MKYKANKKLLFLIFSSILIISCDFDKKQTDIKFIVEKYEKLATDVRNFENEKVFFFPSYFKSNYVVFYNKNKYFIIGNLNYSTKESISFGHHFLANRKYKLLEYFFAINNGVNNYVIKMEENTWRFQGKPIVANFIDRPNNKVEILISTYLISIKDFKYSYDGKKYETIKLREAEFMPFLSIAELKNCFDKKIYLKLEIKNTQINIKDYPQVFYDTLYFAK